jgi:hypothetical protein
MAKARINVTPRKENDPSFSDDDRHGLFNELAVQKEPTVLATISHVILGNPALGETA